MGEEDEHNGRDSLSRREFLKLVGAGLGTGAAASIGATRLLDTDTPTGRTLHGGDAINIVEEGADNTGSEPIDDVLNSLMGQGQTIWFPEGDYLVDNTIQFRTNDLTLIGEHATLRPTSGGGNILNAFGRDWRVSGFEFDFRDVGTPPSVFVGGPDGWRFERTVFRGTRNIVHGEGAAAGVQIAPQVSSESGTGTIQNCYLHEGCAEPDEASNYKAMWAGGGEKIKGTLHINGIWCEHWAENTLYLSNCPGEIIVDNSFFRNTNVGSPRISGPAKVRGCLMVKDGPHPAQAWSGGRAMRLWINSNKPHAHGGVEVRDCDMIWTHSDGASHPINAIQAPESLTIHDTRIHNTTGKASVAVGSGADLDIQNVKVSGSAPASNIDSDGIEKVDGQAATYSCPIPPPPPIGQTPPPMDSGTQS